VYYQIFFHDKVRTVDLFEWQVAPFNKMEQPSIFYFWLMEQDKSNIYGHPIACTPKHPTITINCKDDETLMSSISTVKGFSCFLNKNGTRQLRAEVASLSH
jgi:hypothetical protein